jgi:hypothetical protein
MHNRLLAALLGGTRDFGDRLVLFLFFFLLPSGRRGHWGRICLSHGPRWLSGGRVQSWGRRAGKSWRQGSDRAPHRLRGPSPQKLLGPGMAPAPPSNLGQPEGPPLPIRGPEDMRLAPAPCPRPGPPFFSPVRFPGRPTVSAAPSRGLFISGCRMLRPSPSHRPPSSHLTWGRGDQDGDQG